MEKLNLAYFRNHNLKTSNKPMWHDFDRDTQIRSEILIRVEFHGFYVLSNRALP